jgi:hypothetical protein
MLNAPDIMTAMLPVIDVFEQLGINYHVGGSVASSIYGIPRTTLDADIVADIRPEYVHPLVKKLKPDYYIDEDSVRDAIRRRSSFNAIHLNTMLKVDVFIVKTRSFDQEAVRRTQQRILEENNRPVYLASPEDVILNKLEWYKMGGGVSDRQWNDILGVLKVQGTALDFAYLRKWASALDVADLLDRALEDAGL